MIARLRILEGSSSASRIVLPVKDMNTSSRLGRETLTLVIGDVELGEQAAGRTARPFST